MIKLYSGMAPFLIDVNIIKVGILDPRALRPKKETKRYTVKGNIAYIDGSEEFFRPGGRLGVGDIYLQTIAGPIPATDEDGNVVNISLDANDIIEFKGEKFEIYFLRNEPTVVDVSDYYAHILEVQND